MKRYTKKHARRSLFHTAAFRALSQLATFASFAVLVRGMGEHEFGVLQLLYAVIPVVSTLASFGIEQTLRRYQPEYLQSGQNHAAAWLTRVAAFTRLSSNIVLLAGILLLWDWIAPLFHLQAYRGAFALFGLVILLHFQASILQLSLSSHMLQAYSVGGALILAVTKLALYSVLLGLGQLDLTHAILADLCGYALMYTGLRLLHSRHCVPQAADVPFVMAAAERKRLLRYGLYNNFNDVGSLLLTSRSDNFFIAALINPLAAGAYSFYVRLSEMTGQLLPTRQFGNVIQPLFFAVPADSAARKLPRYMTFLLNVTLVLQLPIASYVTVYHAQIVQLVFGGKFGEYSWLLPLIVWFNTLDQFSTPVTLVAQYQEKASVILWSKLSVLYNVATMLLMVPVWGIYGAAVSTGTAQLLKDFYIWWRVRDSARWLNFRAVLATSLVIWGGVILLCHGLKALLPDSPVLNLASGAVICAMAALLYIRSPALGHSDRELLTSLFHGREARVLNWALGSRA